MIARLLYRKNIHGVLDYVLDKPGRTILSCNNVSEQLRYFPHLLKHYLHFVGNRHETKKRYVHITLNLPHGERLNDKKFKELAQRYMEHMGYGTQPYIIVRHNDTKHEHVHMVTTTVKEDNSLVNTSHDFRRNLSVQRALEKEFGLQPAPDGKSVKKLPILRLPEKRPLPDDASGVKYYMQDILNTLTQKYKIRSFAELSRMLQTYHMTMSTKQHQKRLGISFGINVQDGYKSRFVHGYIVHPKFSAPKLALMFQKNAQSKLLPVHRKRLQKQLTNVLSLFEHIDLKDLPEILKLYQQIDGQIDYDAKGRLVDLTLYDKSGYVFQTKEIHVKLRSRLKSYEESTQKTRLNFEHHQFRLEIKQLIKEVFNETYLDLNRKNKLLSEYIGSKNYTDMKAAIRQHSKFQFLAVHTDDNGNELLERVSGEFETTRDTLYHAQAKKEMKILKDRITLLNTMGNGDILVPHDQKELTLPLVQSLGLKYGYGRLSFMHSNAHVVTANLGVPVLPDNDTSFISTGFIEENTHMLQCLVIKEEHQDNDLRATSFFLPMIFPKVYENLSFVYRVRQEKFALKAYWKAAERLHIPFEKSPLDYIKYFNYKGFYYKKEGEDLYLHSCYGLEETKLKLPEKTTAYLKSSVDFEQVIRNQHRIIASLEINNRTTLPHLWLSYLIERGLYDKAAFLIVKDGLRPNLSPDILEYHMAQGLKEKIWISAQRKIDIRQQRFLRKGVYAFSALLGKSSSQHTELFNEFKDELTDYSKYRRVFL